MFKQRRLTRLARKIEKLEREKQAHYHDFKVYNANDDVEKCAAAWDELTKVCRVLSKYRRTMRKIEVKTKEKP